MPPFRLGKCSCFRGDCGVDAKDNLTRETTNRKERGGQTKVRRATQYIVAPTIAYAAMPSNRLAPLVTRNTATIAMLPMTATTCSMRRSRARIFATCSLMAAPQLGHTPLRLTTRSAAHLGHSILVRSG